MIDPIQCGRDSYEAEEVCGELVVAGGESAVDFDPAEEVFDGVPVAVEFPAEDEGNLTVGARRNANERMGTGEVGAEALGVEALVRDDHLPMQGWDDWERRLDIT